MTANHCVDLGHLLLRRMTKINIHSGSSVERLKEVVKTAAKSFVAMNTEDSSAIAAFIGAGGPRLYPDLTKDPDFVTPPDRSGSGSGSESRLRNRRGTQRDQQQLANTEAQRNLIKIQQQFAANQIAMVQKLQQLSDKSSKIENTQKQEAALGKINREADEWKKDFSTLEVIQAGLLASGAADLSSRIAEAMGSGALSEQSIYDAMGKCTADYLASGYDESMANHATLFSFLWAWVAMSMFLVIRRQYAIENKRISEKGSQTLTDLIWRTMYAIMSFMALYAVATSYVGQVGLSALQYAAEHLALTGTIHDNMTAAAGFLTAATFALPFLKRQLLSQLPLWEGLQFLDVGRRICASGARFYIDTITAKSSRRLTAPTDTNDAPVGAVNVTVGGYSF